MNEKYIHRSERGGQSAIAGFTYQRDFVAFLCARMVCKSENITKLVCEYKNDIEVVLDDQLTSWQIKSTTANSLGTKEIYHSVRLFEFLNSTNEYSQFIIVSNRNFTMTRTDMKSLIYYESDEFPDLKSKIQENLGNLNENLLAKIKFMKGPELDTIRSVVYYELSCLPHNKLIVNDLISFVDNIWIGLKTITQFKIQDVKQRKNEDLDFKTITLERIKKELLHKSHSISQDTDLSSQGFRLFDKINNADEIEIKYLMQKFKLDSEFRWNVLKFDNLSKTTKL